jgi:hypothetical protein
MMSDDNGFGDKPGINRIEEFGLECYDHDFMVKVNKS